MRVNICVNSQDLMRCQIAPCTDLDWTPCFDNYTCARLEVPLDYSNTSLGTTSIAFMKLPAENAPESAENLLLNDGKI
jgi:hypothetical protein